MPRSFWEGGGISLVKLTILKTEGWYNSLGFSRMKDTAKQPDFLVFGEGVSCHISVSTLRASNLGKHTDFSPFKPSVQT